MITNQQLANLIQGKLNGEFSSELGEYTNIHKYGLNSFTPNVRYEFKIFASDGEYAEAENRDAIPSNVTNTVTQYINGVLRTPGGSPVEGASAETLNTVIESQVELLIPNCDEVSTFTSGEGENAESVTIRFQDLIFLLVQDVLSLPSDNTDIDLDGISYFIGCRFSHASMSERQHRTQVGLSVILSMFITFAVVAMGISSRQIKLEIDGEEIYFNRISISRTSTQENNVTANPRDEEHGISRARTTATQMIIAFSAPVRPTWLNNLLSRYIVLGEVAHLPVKLKIPRNMGNDGLEYLEKTYTMTFAEAGIAGEENLNAAYDIRLVEEMEGANG